MITSIELTGYRLLNNFTADFGNLTVIIGANATGKSTLIDAIQFISEGAQFPISNVFEWHGGSNLIFNAYNRNNQLVWKFTFNKKNLHLFWKDLPIKDVDHTYEVNLSSDIYGRIEPIYEVLRYSKPLPGYKDCFKLFESFKDSSFVYDVKVNKLIDFDKASSQKLDENNYKIDNDTKSNEISTESSNNTMKKLSNAYSQDKYLLLAKMRFINDYPNASIIRLLLSSFAFYTGFDVSKSSALRSKPSDIKPVTQLTSAGDNLGTVLHEILTRHDYKDSSEEIIKFIQIAYPLVESIHPETAYGNPPRVLLRIREKNMSRAMELWDLSDGFLRFLCLATAMLNPVPPAFIAFDEPEAGLHPRLLPIVADIIKTAAEKTQVLITTHSPDLLNFFKLDDIAVMTRDESTIGWGRPGNRSSLHTMLEAVQGDTIGDLHRSGELESL